MIRKFNNVILINNKRNQSQRNSTCGVIAFTCYLLLFSFQAFAQDSIVVSGQFIGNTQYAQVQMKKFGVGSFPIAGASIANERFSLTLPPDIAPGVYRFQYVFAQNEKYLDIIINGKDKELHFSLQAYDAYALPQFTQSDENQQWYAYIAENRNQLDRISLLNQFINTYPNAKANVVKAAEQELEAEERLYNQNLESFKTQMHGTWAYEMVANRPYYFTNPKEDPRIQDYYRREHFWDGFDSSNPQLINTPLYTEHILNYLRYWMNPEVQFGKEEMETGFMKSVDTIMQKFSGNEQTKKFALQYLQLGFKEIGQEKVLQYIDETYKETIEQCQNDTEKAAFDQRMAGYAAMKVGNVAPNITFEDGSTLYAIQSEQTMVVFWASWCPHCQAEMPKLNTWAKANPNTKVIAISLDDDRVAYETAIKEYPELEHHTDLKKWNGKAVSEYYVYGTPTYIMLDKDKTILGKPRSAAEINNWVTTNENPLK